MDYDVIIGQRLKKLRESNNHSLEDLAQLVDKHRSTLHLYEIGKVSISMKMLIKILSVYDLTYEEFLKGIK